MPDEVAESYLCLYFGDGDECWNCGGSASLGDTQEPWTSTDVGGRYCSEACMIEAIEFRARHR